MFYRAIAGRISNTRGAVYGPSVFHKMASQTVEFSRSSSGIRLQKLLAAVSAFSISYQHKTCYTLPPITWLYYLVVTPVPYVVTVRKRFCDSIDTLYVTRLRTGGGELWLRIMHTREKQPFFETAYKYTNTTGEEGMRDEGGEEKEKNTVVSSIFFFCRQTRPTGSGYACSSGSSSTATPQQCLLMCRVCAGPHDMPSDDTV